MQLSMHCMRMSEEKCLQSAAEILDAWRPRCLDRACQGVEVWRGGGHTRPRPGVSHARKGWQQDTEMPLPHAPLCASRCW
jgi:hypothetical protein